MSLVCPVCGGTLPTGEGLARCEKGHSFDRARSGYWNLLLDSASHGHGDDKEMLRARRAFLEAGWYRPLTDGVADLAEKALPNGGSLTDAGCGEGSYTAAVLDALATAGKTARAFAFDVSKEAARMTASRLKDRATVFVASAYHIPLSSFSQDLVLSLFSPFAREEFARILKPGGRLLRAVPAEDHLWELKEALYDTPRPNAPDPAEEDALFIPVKTVPVRRELRLPGDAVRSLFQMTPYARKTSSGDVAKLDALRELTVTLSCKLILSEKTCESFGNGL